MTQPAKTMHITLWIAQMLVALFLLTGAILKFQPIEKIAAMMPWAGQVPAAVVRLLGVVDLLGAIGLILPSLLRIQPQLAVWAAIGTIALMACATVFHVYRGEASVIGVNIFCAFIATFIAWGRSKIAPIAAK
jgi:uncharacterized membrane protein